MVFTLYDPFCGSEIYLRQCSKQSTSLRSGCFENRHLGPGRGDIEGLNIGLKKAAKQHNLVQNG
jgi:hypothetical protein